VDALTEFSPQNGTTARTAIADHTSSVCAVGARMNQARPLRLIQHFHPFLFADLARKTPLHKEFSRTAEDEADLFRLVALCHADPAGAIRQRE